MVMDPFTLECQRQRCDDASDTTLLKNKGVTPKLVATPFWSDLPRPGVLKMSSSVIAVLTMH